MWLPKLAPKRNKTQSVLQASPMSDEAHIKRERAKARELRASQWWKQQIGPGLCYHCGKKFLKSELTMDHLIPVARGGKSSKNNVVPSCKPCNRARGHKLDVERTFESLEPIRGFGDDYDDEDYE